MKKMSVTTTLALLLVLILGSTVAYAGFHWCMDDPILTITPPGGDPITVNVLIAIPEGTQDLVSDTVEVKVHVPTNVKVKIILTGDGFGQGEKVKIIKDGEPVDPGDRIEVKVEVLVPATEKIPVKVIIESPGLSKSKRGWSNEWVLCGAKL